LGVQHDFIYKHAPRGIWEGMGERRELTARCEEERVSELDVGEAPHVAEVNDVREDAEEGKEDGETVNNA
jgi:hypothetical protein